MSKTTNNPTLSPAWADLEALAGHPADLRLRDLFEEDRSVLNASAWKWGICSSIIQKSPHHGGDGQASVLAEWSGVSDAVQAMFEGEAINRTEGRAVLHTALRNQSARPRHGGWQRCDA